MTAVLMNARLINGIGYGAAVLTTFSLVPQLARIWRRKSAADISTVMFSLFSFGTLLWLIYGVLSHSMPIALANAVTLAFSVAVLVLKFFFAEEERRQAAKSPPDEKLRA
jgi:MtN3 and saliva related transmembrane protein